MRADCERPAAPSSQFETIKENTVTVPAPTAPCAGCGAPPETLVLMNGYFKCRRCHLPPVYTCFDCGKDLTHIKAFVCATCAGGFR